MVLLVLQYFSPGATRPDEIANSSFYEAVRLRQLGSGLYIVPVSALSRPEHLGLFFVNPSYNAFTIFASISKFLLVILFASIRVCTDTLMN